jgi:hypothetical protein
VTKLLKTIAAAFVSEPAQSQYRYSRGIGPH